MAAGLKLGGGLQKGFELTPGGSVRDCSPMMSAKNGGIWSPPPPLVSQNQQLANPPSPPCQKKSYFVALQFIK